MLDILGQYLTRIADTLCGYPLFTVLIGGGLFLFLYSGMVSVRKLPVALKTLRAKQSTGPNEISSAQALASVVAATVGMGNIAGVAIALVMGGPGAIFWMWVSAIVGMSTKYHEGVLAIKYRKIDSDGRPFGGPMHIIKHALPSKWHPMATFFAVAGMFGTLCIMNANQFTEAAVSTIGTLHEVDNPMMLKFIIGLGIALLVTLVVIGGVKRIATVASVLVPFMVGGYFLMVLYIILTNLSGLPDAIGSIFREAFSLRAGWGALAGIAIIGARRAALVNDAGVGTASIMHGSSGCKEPVKEGLVAMLGPAIDSGFVCTLTALAILLCGDVSTVEGVKGLSVAMDAFGNAIPGGQYLLMAVVTCFALSSMFSYSFYGRSCARFLFGTRGEKIYVWFFILTLVVFAVISLDAAVGLCDLFYALMAFPTMLTLILLRGKVKEETKAFFRKESDVQNALPAENQSIKPAEL
ncbi:MAG: alanine:cation symporter family protein [Firmicutes bacterium]|nr:alanine:cation symporter family protein [Bacillota bacterium]MCM1400910.1 alanine:cation symporter family protein [Bacteroides sp.]MCM1476563.1 alanine:cation symporter family protein [Bacteroides sp.]